jgi:hypothetical protein
MFADLAGWLRQPGAGPQGRDLGKAAMFLFSTTERPDTVQAALQYASRSTGVDFDYLLATAQRESNLDPAAQARTSSARGLFQFIESTWLATFKRAGPSHGYGDLAQRIETDAVAIFGAERCLFGSTFPIEKLRCSWGSSSSGGSCRRSSFTASVRSPSGSSRLTVVSRLRCSHRS